VTYIISKTLPAFDFFVFHLEREMSGAQFIWLWFLLVCVIYFGFGFMCQPVFDSNGKMSDEVETIELPLVYPWRCVKPWWFYQREPHQYYLMWRIWQRPMRHPVRNPVQKWYQPWTWQWTRRIPVPPKATEDETRDDSTSQSNGKR